jgi:hypothetical protein
LRAKNQGISHEAVDESGCALAEVSNGMNSFFINYGAGITCGLNPGVYIVFCLSGRKALIVVVNDDTLFKGLKNRFLEDRIK